MDRDDAPGKGVGGRPPLPTEPKDSAKEARRDLGSLVGLGARKADTVWDKPGPEEPASSGPAFEPTEAAPEPPSFNGPEEDKDAQAQPAEAEVCHARKSKGGSNVALWMEHPEKNGRLLENFRVIKGQLSALKTDQGAQVFLMTGSGPKVGTTTMAYNLALVMAWDLLDQRILLVDANVPRPMLHDTLNLPAEPGLLDYLLTNITLDEILWETQWPNLDFVPVGCVPDLIASLFDLERFETFLSEARDRYDLILLDSAPLLMSSQTRIISTRTDGVIIVAEANGTRWEVLREIKRQLEADHAKIVGGILNKRRFVIPRWAYRFI